MTRRLVFGDDQSQAADVAWLWINSHDWPDWKIEVVTATGSLESAAVDLRQWEPRHPREFLRDALGLEVSHERSSADPIPALAGLGDRDLLVVGPKGRGFRKTLHLGSISEALMNCPPMPMVIARHGVATTRAVVCADGSPDCQAAVEALAGMPWLGRVEVLVVGVPQAGIETEATVQHAAGILKGAARSVRAEVLVPDELQIVVDTQAMLLEAANWWETDLLVLGTRGLSGFGAIKAGSIAKALAARASCSVLLARDT